MMFDNHITKKNIMKFKVVVFLLLIVLFSSDHEPNLVYSQVGMEIHKISSVSGVGYDICIKENCAYISSNDGLEIIDIQDPYNPKRKTRLDITDGSFGVYIEGDTAFIAADTSGLVIANITNPLEPVIIGQSSNHGVASNVFVHENLAFLACYEDGLKIFDVSNKTNPIKIGEYTESGRIDNVVCRDDILYLTNPNLGVEVINITNPSVPVKIATISEASSATGISIFDNFLFVGCYDSSVWIIDISSPIYPSIIGSHSDSDGGEALGVIGNSTHLYIADNYGIEYKNISNLPSITEEAEIRVGINAAHDIEFKGNYLFVAGGSATKCLLIFEVGLNQTENSSHAFLEISVTLIVISGILQIYLRHNKNKKIT